MHTEPRLRPLSVGLGVGFIGGELFHVAFHLGWIDGALVIGSGVDWILTLATGALAVTAWLGPRAAARIEASEPTGRANLVATWLPLGILVISVSTHMSELDDHWLIVLGGAVVVLMSRLTFTILHNAELASVLEEQATHDQLTGLPNRSSLGTAFDELGDDLQAMMIIDLDRFKAVNDQLGMAVGDQLLRDVAGRLTNVLPVDWTIARVGGDEFTAITAHGYEPDELRVVAGTVVDALTPSFTVLGREAWIGASIGAAAVGGDIDRTDLGAVADLALRHAKQAGRGEVVIGDAGLRRRAGDAAELASEIAAALDRGEFACVYQPKVDLTTGDLIGVEALVRWHHPGRGLLLPGEFLDVAEATGLIARIDAEVLSSAVAQLAEWTELAPDRALRLSTNMSAWQLARHDVAEDVERALDRAGGRVDPDLVTIELTETLLIDDPLVVRRRLERLRSTGVHVSVDDFGAGFTSVAHLREFPISEVKIDRALTAELEEDLPAGRSVAGAVIALATALGLAVVAEGVESVGQARRLRGLGCRDAQGFLFSPPVPPEQITAWLGVAHPFAGLVGQEWSTTRSRAESAP